MTGTTTHDTLPSVGGWFTEDGVFRGDFYRQGKIPYDSTQTRSPVRILAVCRHTYPSEKRNVKCFYTDSQYKMLY